MSIPVVLRRTEVQRVTGLPRSSLYAKIAKGEFPEPVKLGARAVGWRNSDVEAWLNDLQPANSLTGGGAK